MSSLFIVAGNELRQRLRDRSALIVAFVAPLTLTALISLVPFESGFHASFVVADEDAGILSTVFVDDVLGSAEIREVADIGEVDSIDAARREVDAGRADAAFVLPAGFSDDALSGAGTGITVVVKSDKPIAGAVARSIGSGFSARLDAYRIASQAAEDTGSAPPTLDSAASGTGVIDVVPQGAGGRELTSADYFAPAMAIFFVFFAVGTGARSLLTERSNGTLTRLRASPLSARTLLFGKALASFVIGLVSMLVVIGASALLLGARWGDPVAVLGLIVAVTLVATAITWTIATFVTTEEQAVAFTSLVAVGLGLLGGSFFPLALAPERLQRLASLTPNGQALQGFTDLSIDAGGAALTGRLVVLVCIALVVGAVALTRSHRLVER